MAKLNWHRIAEKDLIRRHGSEVVEHQRLDGWNRRSRKPLYCETIDLGIHEKHDWQPIIGSFGPHKGKIICKTCDKFVTWIKEEYVRLICRK